MSQLEFKSYIVVTLMRMDEQAIENDIQGEERTGSGYQVSFPSRRIYGRPSKVALPMDIRFDNVGHVIIEEENKARRRCRQCKNNTIYMCAKCHVHLHANCFDLFHAKC
ncbi:piggyBac transposable element-derived protein 3-like [Belonocnema kinseyi]|uniref:piggyBac transposable element-derived protein 3-like n=1 Tax=Belonocnema kinseyi TaxID=2817044 RepID=UPI00143E0D90|nr:piggyBac transposable element-derived protein 3-like [Belonocnema kinseyi]